MKSLKLTLPLVTLAGFVLAGCPSDDAPVDSESTTEGTGSTGQTPTTTPPETTVEPDTSAGTDQATGSSGTTAEGSTTEVGPGPFVFDETDPGDYLPFDRKGFPAINTGLNLLGDKNAYNQASPQDDAALAFVTDILTSLEVLHLGAPDNQVPDNTGLDDDLATFGLEPCVAPPLPMDSCDDQGGPFAIPDVLTLDYDEPPTFPNGRRFEDPAMDIIFAVLLLDLDTHDVSTFVDLDQDGTPGPSLNPTANDVEFAAEFPYLAQAHE